MSLKIQRLGQKKSTCILTCEDFANNSGWHIKFWGRQKRACKLIWETFSHHFGWHIKFEGWKKKGLQIVWEIFLNLSGWHIYSANLQELVLFCWQYFGDWGRRLFSRAKNSRENKRNRWNICMRLQWKKSYVVSGQLLKSTGWILKYFRRIVCCLSIINVSS